MLTRRLVLICCVLIALACKIGEIGVDSSILQMIANPSPVGRGDVKTEPAAGRRNTLIPVTFSGEFPLETWVVAGTGIGVSAVNQPNASEIQAAVTIAADAPVGPQLLTLTNSRGEQLTARFIVLPEEVTTVTSVTPNRIYTGATTTVTVKGTQFFAGLSIVSISGDGDIDAGLPTIVDAETITVPLIVRSDAMHGVRQLWITNRTEESNGALITVLPPPPPSFVLSSVTPASIEVGRSATVTLTGTNFRPNAAVIFEPSAGIKATMTSVTATSAVANIAVSSTAAPGPRSVRIGNTSEDMSNPLPMQITMPIEAEIGFRGSPAIIGRGGSATLSWNVETIPSTLTVQCALLVGTTKIADVPCRSGERVVSPTTTTEYKLTVAGAGLSDWAYTTVVVEEAGGSAPSSSNSQTFSTTGTHSFTVPAGVTQITMEVSGAAGGTGGGSTPSNNGAAGGRGGKVTASVSVTPGETLTVVVGVAGSTAVNGGAYGFGGNGTGIGANGGSVGIGGGGGGGGSSVSRGSTMLAIAGGGGGGGGNFGAVAGGVGGAGGGAGAAGSGQAAATSAAGGSGATQAAVGTGGAGAGHAGGNGTIGASRDGGIGGEGSNASSGGGGGGGGGAFGGGGGGGGSQFSGTAQSGGGGGGGSSSTIGSATGVSHQQGAQSGNGLVVIRW